MCTKGNMFIKFADDTTLLVGLPASNSWSIQAEIYNINKWANTNNQMLNKAKCAELIITRKRTSARSISPPPLLPDLSRVEQLTLLGVELDERLSFPRHIDTAIITASQNLYALKTLKSHGLPPQALDTVCRATLLARLTYASPCWWDHYLQQIEIDCKQ